MPDEPLFLKQGAAYEGESKAMRVARKSATEATLEPLQLGQRVRAIRLSQNLTLEEASKRTGLARSTLSKIENEQISPTFSAVNKLVHGLGIDIPQLFAQPRTGASAGGRRTRVTPARSTSSVTGSATKAKNSFMSSQAPSCSTPNSTNPSPSAKAIQPITTAPWGMRWSQPASRMPRYCG